MIRRARQIAVFGVLSASLAACGMIDSDSDFLRMGGVVLQETGLFGGGTGVTRETAAAVPYASIGVRLGSSEESLLVLATSTGDTRHWQAGTHVAIVTRDGRITTTVGLTHNLDTLQGPFPDSPSRPPESGGAYHFIMDMVDMGQYGILSRCTQHDEGAERIIIIGVAHDAHHIVEDCRAKQLSWSYSNEFWRDSQTGYVWKSVQNFRPDMDALTLEVFRPEG